ncbi:cephalosporin hydroxylase family protein [Aurantiacibacter rhizosphaerae]|uniref:Cephalosporin hydroxylase n=1 Tax=Aurantiacibacter rhizosphaerae TaxID=2691582 RepID=A0A844XA67_9SPHN|nr:cephalosporin hydroxylase family protein [Aurantiacibacter rhizosphaerae]MWV26693.1 cephalosporin hydroxylase [Aurantiacibacter rhizosphaerae]
MTDKAFEQRRADLVTRLGNDADMAGLTDQWLGKAQELGYSYNFDWLGLPIIQYPQDIVAMQELIWKIQPDVIVETGVARGGSLIFYASMMELVANCGGNSDGRVIGIDIDIRQPNRDAIEAHAMAKRIELVQGSSIDTEVVDQVRDMVGDAAKVLVCLDSNHTHDHVLEELRAYAPMTTPGSYCVVFDTLVENLPDAAIGDRPWGKGNNPLTAVRAYREESDAFETDARIHDKLQVSVAREGYLRRRG